MTPKFMTNSFTMIRLTRDKVRRLTTTEVMRGNADLPATRFPRYVCDQCGHQAVSWGVAKRHAALAVHIKKAQR